MSLLLLYAVGENYSFIAAAERVNSVRWAFVASVHFGCRL